MPKAKCFITKIDKDPATWTIPYEIPPAHPIISDWDSEIYGMSEFIEYHLNLLSIRHKSYIKGVLSPKGVEGQITLTHELL